MELIDLSRGHVSSHHTSSPIRAVAVSE